MALSGGAPSPAGPDDPAGSPALGSHVRPAPCGSPGGPQGPASRDPGSGADGRADARAEAARRQAAALARLREQRLEKPAATTVASWCDVAPEPSWADRLRRPAHEAAIEAKRRRLNDVQRQLEQAKIGRVQQRKWQEEQKVECVARELEKSLQETDEDGPLFPCDFVE
mmetsp:Transcript_6616/g.16308  ORF Transcript_6616/g.16308 Transcript_6616/m.16308 type:complete len:169 (+) Transcript_6616:35-541(+)